MLRLPLVVLAVVSTLTVDAFAAPQADSKPDFAALRLQVQAIAERSPSPAVNDSVRAYLRGASASELQAFAA